MGRNSQCIIPAGKFRELLLDRLVSRDGMKVSLLTLFKNEEFMKTTGYYNLKTFAETGEYRAVSPGTISYIIKKFDLHELELYYHHKYITKRIGSNVSFNQFSRDKNRDYKKGRYGNSMKKHNNLREIPRERLTWALNSISKMLDGYYVRDICYADANMSYQNLIDYSERLRLYMGSDEEYVVLLRERLTAFRSSYITGDKYGS